MNAKRRSRNLARPDPARPEILRLNDGRDVVLRPIDAADAAPIAAGFELLNENEIRHRYLHPVKALSEGHLHRLTHPAEGDDFVLVAAEPLPPGEALVGAVARLARDSADRSRAEFALLVSHYLCGQGLGRHMLQRLLDWSRRHGLREVWGDVADDNLPMLRLAQAMGFRRESILGSPGVIRITHRLA